MNLRRKGIFCSMHLQDFENNKNVEKDICQSCIGGLKEKGVDIG